MTRERYKEYMIRRWSRNILYMEEEMNRDIDTIFDNIESRVCKNCKHYEARTKTGNLGECNNNIQEGFSVGLVYDYDIDLIPKDFGCNRFERKLESK